MIRVGIVGYGNIGRGVELAITHANDMLLTAVFTRRDPNELKIKTPSVPVFLLEHAENMKDEIDVMLLCGGSAKDLPEQTPWLAAMFNTVDTFDTHAKIPEYMAAINQTAINKTAIISVGWDPGLFSMLRLLGGAVLPNGIDYTFWGSGVSQGHSDAIRSLDGIKKDSENKKMAVQYTVPSEKAMTAVRSGTNPQLSTRDKHLRECFVVPEDGANHAKIEREIKEMPNYFADYETIVNFIDENEFQTKHQIMPHGGHVFRSGITGGNKQLIEFNLKLESNPEFTASVMVAYARAAVRMSNEGRFGAQTAFDIPLTYLSPKSRNDLIKELL